MSRSSLAVSLLLLMAAHAQFTVPMVRDAAFEKVPPSKALDAIFARWSIPQRTLLSSTLLWSKPSASHHRKRRLPQSDMDPRLLGLDAGNLLAGVVGQVGDLLDNVIYDPLFGSNVVKATGEGGDTEWYGTLAFGNPPQQITLNFDTGSADLFLLDPQCSTCDLSNHTAFIPSQSTSYHNASTAWSTVYGDGTGASGYVSRDSSWITGDPSSSSTSNQMQIPNFQFAMANTITSSLGTSTPSGLVGLGQDRLSNIQGGATIFSRLVTGHQMNQNVLGIRLVKGQRGLNPPQVIGSGGGGYAFGHLEDQWIVGAAPGLTWVRVTSSNYWGVPMPNVQMGLGSVLDSGTPRRAIIDTGTSLIVTSQALAAAVHTKIPRAYLSRSSVWIVPCAISSDSLSANYTPNLFFTLGGRRFGVPSADLAWKAIANDRVWCVSGVQGGVEDFTILGSMFIKNHYVALRYNDDSSLSVGLGDRTDVSPIL